MYADIITSLAICVLCIVLLLMGRRRRYDD